MTAVLVLDDEENIVFLVETALQLNGFETLSARNGHDAIAIAQRERIDLAVLDVRLPDLDGFTVLRRLREIGCDAPVIFLTARDGTDERIHGLTIGGDDYMVKPFAVVELIARVQRSLARSSPAARSTASTRNLVVADLEIDDDAHRVSRAGQVVHLSPTEYALLRYLMVNSGRVVSRAQILDHVWSYDFDGCSSIVDTFVSSVRRKVDFTEPKLIHTVCGLGFSLRKEL